MPIQSPVTTGTMAGDGAMPDSLVHSLIGLLDRTAAILRIEVDDLSAVARRSTAPFCRLFKRPPGETPHGFVTSRRLHRAAPLMLTSNDPLSQIAVRCGFSDQAHFCNRFRAAMGQSPAAWRRERRDLHRDEDNSHELAGNL